MRRVLTSRTFLTWVLIIAIVNLVLFTVQRYVAVPMSVPSASMEPVLKGGDRILVQRTHASASKLARTIERGDVIVFRAPEAGHPLVVKRVIGLPGESIQAVDGLIAIDNSKVLAETWLPDRITDRGTAAAKSVDIKRTKLGAHEVFVMGDNRAHSIDSREYGPVDLADVVGTTSLRFWPPTRLGMIKGTVPLP